MFGIDRERPRTRAGRREQNRDRAAAPAVGAVALLAVTAVTVALLGGAAMAVTDDALGPGVTTASLDLEADGDRIVLVHRGGDALDVRDVRLRIEVGGEPLAHQPSVPFFAQRGFRGGPTGPFNGATDHAWTVGETAALRVAGTNDPTPQPGDRIRVRVSVGERTIADLTARS